jgi:hypothetical protein
MISSRSENSFILAGQPLGIGRHVKILAGQLN